MDAGGVEVEWAVICGAARRPFGKFDGALSPSSTPELLVGAAIRKAIERSGGQGDAVLVEV